eukprot:3515943-Heterocapsa_arctica.AAC.1
MPCHGEVLAAAAVATAGHDSAARAKPAGANLVAASDGSQARRSQGSRQRPAVKAKPAGVVLMAASAVNAWWGADAHAPLPQAAQTPTIQPTIRWRQANIDAALRKLFPGDWLKG